MSKFAAVMKNGSLAVEKALPDLRPTDVAKRATLPIARHATELCQAKRERDAAQLAVELSTGLVKKFLGDATVLLDPTGTELLATYRPSKPQMVLDEEALKAAHPKIYAKFLKPAVRRPLLTKG